MPNSIVIRFWYQKIISAENIFWSIFLFRSYQTTTSSLLIRAPRLVFGRFHFKNSLFCYNDIPLDFLDLCCRHWSALVGTPDVCYGCMKGYMKDWSQDRPTASPKGLPLRAIKIRLVISQLTGIYHPVFAFSYFCSQNLSRRARFLSFFKRRESLSGNVYPCAKQEQYNWEEVLQFREE